MGIPSLLEPWLARRDRLLSSAGFQAAVLRIPLLRRIAQRRASQLFDLCAGFVYSQVLFACVRLGLFELLRRGPRPVSELAQSARIPPEAMLPLVQAAVALRLLQWRGSPGCCGLGVHGAALLGNPGLSPLIEHHSLLYADLQDPPALLRSVPPAGQLQHYWAYASATAAAAVTSRQAAPYSTLMGVSQALVAQMILEAYPLARHRSLLDVGGGDGTFASLAARRAPGLQVRCFDVPAVAALAEARFAAEKLGARARAIAGDFHNDRLPSGADLISLIRVLHDHGDAQVVRLLRSVHAALPADGTLLIAEPMAGTPGGARVAEAYFGIYLLAMGSGKPRSPAQLSQLLERAGFTRVRLHETGLPMFVRVMTARRDAATSM
ncbi:MAG: methyltransferase domain-containing protein [Proteobacteria bacterium]|nr:methyltransferase domain-containing protein [Pseudomonadota bacterium]